MQAREAEAGISQLCRNLEIFRATGAEVAMPWLLALRAEAHARAGHTEDALAALAEALATVNRTSERHYEAELYRLRGELLLTEDSADRAIVEACFRGAIKIARQQRSRSLELRATASLARLLRDTEGRDEALTMLADICDWFTEGFDTADLKEAKALLDELNALTVRSLLG